MNTILAPPRLPERFWTKVRPEDRGYETPRGPVRSAMDDLLAEVDRLRTDPPRAGTVTVTRAQRPILLGLANGETYTETAARLGCAPDTVRTHRLRLYRRLGARNGGPHAVALAMAAGLIRPGQINPPGGDLP